ncbi:hypothetical protein J22TS1_46390 [Siminovitchia terrae]|nr:hypothetical protein J22TS1_46390 [Siminovitchia terrae]
MPICLEMRRVSELRQQGNWQGSYIQSLVAQAKIMVCATIFEKISRGSEMGLFNFLKG